MNPCPCGYFNHPEKECVCGPGVVQRYLNKISGPLLDRIDLHVEVTPVSYDELTSTIPNENSASIRTRVIKARGIQEKRYLETTETHCNAQMTQAEFELHCNADEQGHLMIKQAMQKMGLSARAFERILKVARTIADLDENEKIQVAHIAEAIQFRSLDKGNWGSN